MDVRALMAGHGLPAPSDTGARAFSTGQIGLAALVGTPVAGAVLMAINYRRANRAGLGAIAVAVAVLVTGAQLTCARFVPAIILPFVFVPPLLLMMFLASHHDREVGSPLRASMPASLGVTVLGLGAAIGAWQVLPRAPYVEYKNGGRVEYRDHATRDEARTIGDALADTGYFDTRGDLTVIVEQDFNHRIVANVPAWSGAYDPYYQTVYDALVPQLDHPLSFRVNGDYDFRYLDPPR